ncbi:ABC transporter permease [Phytohabitans flavus]|uniref:ABC transporter permease n=1 Tax=Phytohabitans flavus TaxID=1076124 RepID=UPI003630E0CC
MGHPRRGPRRVRARGGQRAAARCGVGQLPAGGRRVDAEPPRGRRGPETLLAPVLQSMLGFGMTPRVVMVWAMCLFPITLAAHAGLSQTPAELAELARAMCASRLRTLRTIRLPAALPAVFVGLKQALPLAVIGAVVGELFGGTEGLGFVIATAGTDAALAFAAIVLLAAMTIALHSLAKHAETLLVPWIRHTTS